MDACENCGKAFDHQKNIYRLTPEDIQSHEIIGAGLLEKALPWFAVSCPHCGDASVSFKVRRYSFITLPRLGIGIFVLLGMFCLLN